MRFKWQEFGMIASPLYASLVTIGWLFSCHSYPLNPPITIDDFIDRMSVKLHARGTFLMRHLLRGTSGPLTRCLMGPLNYVRRGPDVDKL